jgi:hypothetical protein
MLPLAIWQRFPLRVTCCSWFDITHLDQRGLQDMMKGAPAWPERQPGMAAAVGWTGRSSSARAPASLLFPCWQCSSAIRGVCASSIRPTACLASTLLCTAPAGKPFDPEGVGESVAHVRSLIGTEVAAGIPLSRSKWAACRCGSWHTTGCRPAHRGSHHELWPHLPATICLPAIPPACSCGWRLQPGRPCGIQDRAAAAGGGAPGGLHRAVHLAGALAEKCEAATLLPEVLALAAGCFCCGMNPGSLGGDGSHMQPVLAVAYARR